MGFDRDNSCQWLSWTRCSNMVALQFYTESNTSEMVLKDILVMTDMR